MTEQPSRHQPPPPSWSALWAERLLHWVHELPHLNFQFETTHESFTLDLNSQYAQSLALFGMLSLFIALLLLLIIVVVWVCQCCRRSSDNAHSRRHVRRLSTALFLLSVICFALLGCCLYGNEHVNKSVNSAIAGLQDFNHQLRSSLDATHQLNYTRSATADHLEQLATLINKKSAGLNQTVVNEIDSLLTDVSDKVDDVKQALARLGDVQPSIRFMERAARYGSRVEFERWLACLTMLMIMVAVLFAGVIAFCRQSRKGAITFSGLGIVIFLVTWLLYALVSPLVIAYADFCSDGASFLRSHINAQVLDTVEFYRDCQPNGRLVVRVGQLPQNGQLPPKLPVEEINEQYLKIQESQEKLETLLYIVFNRSQDVESLVHEISVDIANSFKSVGALESYLSCRSVHSDVSAMYEGFCHHGFLGSTLVGAALKLLGFFLFILLLVVSRSWHIFIRLPNDYTEVCDDDHFTPRGGLDQPENVYDTNVFNPRARQLGGMVDRYGDANVDSASDIHRRSTTSNVGAALLLQPPTHSASLLPNGSSGVNYADHSPLLAEPSGNSGGSGGSGTAIGLANRNHMSMSSERSLYLRGQHAPTAPLHSNTSTGTLGKRNSSAGNPAGTTTSGNSQYPPTYTRQQYHLLNNHDFHLHHQSAPDQQHYNA